MNGLSYFFLLCNQQFVRCDVLTRIDLGETFTPDDVATHRSYI